jgi:hypothetical protein
VTYRVLTRTTEANGYVAAALEAEMDLQRFDHLNRIERGALLRYRADWITRARDSGVSLSDLAHQFGKSPEWVRQAEKRGQAS